MQELPQRMFGSIPSVHAARNTRAPCAFSLSPIRRMPKIRILAVGRLKTPHWQQAAAHYAKRLSRGFTLEEHLVKDADAQLPLAERKRHEAAALAKHLRPSEIVICLDEKGTSMSSTDFAETLRAFFNAAQTPCFIVGGAYGLDASLLKRADRLLAFGPMTLPHEMARVLLLEQLYRAQNILAGTGYHH